jgi:hypothetical protein
MDNKQKTCFVLMPFADDLKEIYTDVYVPACNDLNLHCWRVDEIARPGSISRDIVEGILDADIIIADLTRQNPNVFYELGIAHSTSNKTIMTSQALSDVPFDIRNYRVILYEHSLRGCKALRSTLVQAITELLTALDRTSNPFQDVVSARGSVRVHGKVPLTKICDMSSFPARLRNWFIDHSIVYVSDITTDTLNALAETPGIGRQSLSVICTVLMQKDLFEDIEWLHTFVLKHGIDVTGSRRYYS